MQCKKLFAVIIFALFLDCDVFSQAPAQEDFPLVMYVTARAGLRVRRAAAPSLDSEIVDALPYGSFIKVEGRQDNPVTISGITDYWYRLSVPDDWTNNIYRWVFGGFLSRELPEDLPVVIGEWNFLGDNRMEIVFTPDYRFWHGMKGTSAGGSGTWSMNGNTITMLVSTFPNMKDFDDLGEEVIRTVYVQVNITDRNNIILISSPRGFLHFNSERLTRSRDGRR